MDATDNDSTQTVSASTLENILNDGNTSSSVDQVPQDEAAHRGLNQTTLEEAKQDAEALLREMEEEEHNEQNRKYITSTQEADTVASGTVETEDPELRSRYENALDEDLEVRTVSERIWEVTTESGNTYTVVPADLYSSSPDHKYRDVKVDKCLFAAAMEDNFAKEQLIGALDNDVDSDTVDELTAVTAQIAELERRAEELSDEIGEERNVSVQVANMLEEHETRGVTELFE